MEVGLAKKERKQRTIEVATAQVDLGSQEQFSFQENIILLTKCHFLTPHLAPPRSREVFPRIQEIQSTWSIHI